MALASEAGADCNPPAAVSGETVVWDWGQDWGDPTSIGPRLFPVQLPNLKGVVAIAVGNAHSLALKNDGTVWGWGFNIDGELGDGTNADRLWDAPAQVLNLSGITAVAAGQNHSLAIKNDRTVWAWGWNPRGALGDGTETDRNTPVQVINLSGAKAIAAGGYHSLALKSDGTVWAWGANDRGQLGDGTTIQRPAPVPVPNLSGVAGIAGSADADYTLALKGDGTVWAWGANDAGQLGDGTTTDRHAPVRAKDLTAATAIAPHSRHTLAIKTIASPFDGVVEAWGNNQSGQLGDGEPNQPFIARAGATCLPQRGHGHRRGL